MADIGWRRRRGSSPAARRGARQRAGLTAPPPPTHFHASGRRFTHNSSGQSKNPLTAITVSTATRTARVHHACRRRGRVAAGGERAAVTNPGGRVSQLLLVVRCVRATLPHRIPSRPKTGGLRRQPERGDRIPKGRKRI